MNQRGRVGGTGLENREGDPNFASDEGALVALERNLTGVLQQGMKKKWSVAPFSPTTEEISAEASALSSKTLIPPLFPWTI